MSAPKAAHTSARASNNRVAMQKHELHPNSMNKLYHETNVPLLAQ